MDEKRVYEEIRECVEGIMECVIMGFLAEATDDEFKGEKLTPHDFNVIYKFRDRALRDIDTFVEECLKGGEE